MAAGMRKRWKAEGHEETSEECCSMAVCGVDWTLDKPARPRKESLRRTRALVYYYLSALRAIPIKQHARTNGSSSSGTPG